MAYRQTESISQLSVGNITKRSINTPRKQIIRKDLAVNLEFKVIVKTN